ncbi:MAG: hypothetical protein A2Z20_12335 [Bdellovibrionales bacterium RBG_16_40_8]|nr:MAG: hypothetical protein A2Z20_12335 [Bdellovibrionales bacterium RBG_16_40_8]
MKNILLIIGALILSGCTTILYKDGATQEDYKREFGQCDYEVALHAQGVDQSLNTMFGQELDLAMRKKELILKCMQNKGWNQKAR